VGPEGAAAAVLVYRQIVAHSVDPETGEVRYDLDGAGLQLQVEPLNGVRYTPRGTLPDSPVSIEVIDLNGDGLSDAVTKPRWNDSLRFAESGLAGWPRILSATKLTFRCAHLDSRPHMRQYKNTLYFNKIRPSLYNPGPKEATISDVEGDGLWEVDVAYSLEDGADTWQVDRYRWNGEVYTCTETLSRPAADPLSAQEFQTVAQALEPLHDMAAIREEQPQRVELQVRNLIDLDVDGDGRSEKLLSYFARGWYERDIMHRLDGYAGMALFDPEGQLLWHSQPEEVSGEGALYISSLPVSLSHDEWGVFFHTLRISTGSGRWPRGRVTLYRWDGHDLAPVWEYPTINGGNQGAGYGSYTSQAARLVDVDGDRRNEVLTETIERFWDRGVSDYAFYFPGELVFRWNGEAFVPGELIQGERSLPLRPRMPVFLAPRVSVPLTIDGSRRDREQLEFAFAGGPAWYGSNRLWGWRVANISLAWDEQSLYLSARLLLTQTLTLAFDVDLTGDLDTSLNGDDFVFDIAFSGEEPSCAGPVIVQPRHPAGREWAIQTATAPSANPHGDWEFCTLEMAIPLQELGLDGRELVPKPGWFVEEEYGDPYTYIVRKYYPAAGRTIGFGIGLDAPDPYVPHVEDDPTTWYTLVFMADR
jgi:hypothetical protein